MACSFFCEKVSADAQESGRPLFVVISVNCLCAASLFLCFIFVFVSYLFRHTTSGHLAANAGVSSDQWQQIAHKRDKNYKEKLSSSFVVKDCKVDVFKILSGRRFQSLIVRLEMVYFKKYVLQQENEIVFECLLRVCVLVFNYIYLSNHIRDELFTILNRGSKQLIFVEN